MSQITIRAIPDTVESEIRRVAAQNRVSLSKAAILLLQRAMGIDHLQDKKRDLSCVFGRWSQSDFDDFQENIRQFEVIDDDIWE